MDAFLLRLKGRPTEPALDSYRFKLLSLFGPSRLIKSIIIFKFPIMGGSALIQLIATGKQNEFLTGNPEITFFKGVYRQHTHFAMQTLKLDKQHFSGSSTIMDEHSKLLVTIPNHGDLIHKTYVQSSTPGIIDGGAIIEEVTAIIGKQTLVKHTKEYLQILSELTTPASKQDALKMSTHSYGNQNRPSTGTVQIPLQFWFCRDIELAYPLIATTHHDVQLNFTWGTLNEVGVAADLDIYMEYIYLDEKERLRFASTTHQYIIEQVQYINKPMTHSNTLFFNHPVKELYWTISDNFHYGHAQIRLNDTDPLRQDDSAHFEIMPEEYYQLYQPLNYHTSVPGTNINITPDSSPIGHCSSLTKRVNCYSFSLNPDHSTPSGTLNFSRILDVSLKFEKHSPTSHLTVYAINYNLLKVVSDMAGLSYAS